MADDPMSALKARFRARCVADAARLRAHLAGHADPGLEQLVHGLAGAAGTFGYPDLSAAAVAIDARFAAREVPDDPALADLADRLERLA